MATNRIAWRSGAPSTDFYFDADLISQSQAGNYSVVRVYANAVNRGSTGSYDNNQGAHTAAIDGYGQAQHTGTLPSGYATNQQRWSVSADITLGHDGAGNLGVVTLRQTVSGWFSNVQTVGMGPFPRIPKRPSPVNTPTFTNILPTSVDVNFVYNGDNGGSGIDGYLVRYWPNAEGTGSYVDVSQNLTEPRVVTGLTPGKEYRFVVYAHNGSADNNGYSNISGAAVVRTLSGMWTKVTGTWHRTIPYLKVAGVWKTVSVFIKDAGTWKRGG